MSRSHTEVYARRRTALLNKMQRGVALLTAAPEQVRNGDAHYPYRQASDFYYLTGFNEPEAALLLVAGDSPRAILFCREKDIEREIWDGHRYGPDSAKEIFGFDAAHPITELDRVAEELLADQPALYYALGANTELDTRVLRWRSTVQQRSRSGIHAPDTLHDIRQLLNEMRLYKDEHELDLMRRAAAISSAAHQRAMRHTRPGLYEYQVEAELLHEFCRHGARDPAYTSIVAGGANACTLHYVGNDALLHDGDLLLIDAGCELGSYASDITRTFPINGKFSSAQRDVYELVLAAQTAAIDTARCDAHWNSPHDAALRVLAQGFIDLELCHGTVDAVIESGSYKQFYMHRTGHWLGMDVHDVGDYKLGADWRPLEAGMVLTVEPGCYIRPADKVPEALWNIGIRIEDDVLITKTGNEILSAAAPKTVADIEAVMRHE